MKRFEYRLQRVLDVKEIRERERLEEVARRRRTLEEAERSLARLRAERERAEEEARAEDRPLRPRELEGRHAWLVSIADAVRGEEGRVMRLGRELRDAQRRLTQAGKERKTLERARDHSKDLHRKTADRHEQGRLDEVAGQRHGAGKDAA